MNIGSTNCISIDWINSKRKWLSKLKYTECYYSLANDVFVINNLFWLAFITNWEFIQVYVRMLMSSYGLYRATNSCLLQIFKYFSLACQPSLGLIKMSAKMNPFWFSKHMIRPCVWEHLSYNTKITFLSLRGHIYGIVF